MSMKSMKRKSFLDPFSHHEKKAAIFSLLLIFSSCNSELDVEPKSENTPFPTEYAEGNNWILENMQFFYLWNEHLPTDYDIEVDPLTFFESLLYTYDLQVRPEGDRFSYMVEDATELEASLNGQETAIGAEFTFYLLEEGAEDVIAQIVYVLPKSPAEKAGLKRGDIIYEVNGQTLDIHNYYSSLYKEQSLSLGIADLENGQIIKNGRTADVTAEIIQENPVFLDSIYSIGSNRIGYLIYNQFIPGPNGSSVATYDNQINQIFSAFQSSDITELIIDLRYNPGGYISSAVNLASLVGSGIDESMVFYKQEWNSSLSVKLKNTYGEEFLVENFLAKNENVGNLLNRVYVLTSSYTASASELLINGLMPYMDVYIIGSATTGKNVGSLTITDEDGAIPYGLQPVVFKCYNSLGQSDYTAGFDPDIEAQESLELKDLGNVDETLLQLALGHISGTPSARIRQDNTLLPLAGSSVAKKAGRSNMFYSKEKIIGSSN